MVKKFIVSFAVFLLLIGLSLFVNAETNFKFDQESVEVKLNSIKYLSYGGGTGTITWTSEDSTIATVDNGTVKGLKIGETKITAIRGEEKATCTVKVVYGALQIGANQSNSVSKVNLVLNEHDTETLYAIAKDGAYVDVENPAVNWKSSDPSIVTIDSNTGKMTALKSGKVTITAESTGVSDTCEVTVWDAIDFTDFKNAKYETSIVGYDEHLKITGITPKDTFDYKYYYMITPNSTKPEIIIKNRSY